ERRDGEPVLRRYRIEGIGSREAAARRNVLRDDARMARQVLREMAGGKPRLGGVAAGPAARARHGGGAAAGGGRRPGRAGGGRAGDMSVAMRPQTPAAKLRRRTVGNRAVASAWAKSLRTRLPTRT